MILKDLESQESKSDIPETKNLSSFAMNKKSRQTNFTTRLNSRIRLSSSSVKKKKKVEDKTF